MAANSRDGSGATSHTVLTIASKLARNFPGLLDCYPSQRKQMLDCRFSFLTTTQVELLSEVLARRNASLAARVQRAGAVSRSDAEQIVEILNDELVNNLDETWEPTDYGRSVSGVLTKFNVARIGEWP